MGFDRINLHFLIKSISYFILVDFHLFIFYVVKFYNDHHHKVSYIDLRIIGYANASEISMIARLMITDNSFAASNPRIWTRYVISYELKFYNGCDNTIPIHTLVHGNSKQSNQQTHYHEYRRAYNALSGMPLSSVGDLLRSLSMPLV